MFSYVKTKALNWWQNQVTVLNLEPAQEETFKTKEALKTNQKQSNTEGDNKPCVLIPRACYFETAKEYPLSVGQDITKISKVDVLQVSPYTDTWNASLVLKQPDKYLVYYFSLLPKYQHFLNDKSPIVIIPHSALYLYKKIRNKIPEESISALHFYQNEENVWLTKPAEEIEKSDEKLAFSALNFNLLKSFYNPTFVSNISAKLNRWWQLKAIASLALITLFYGVLAKAYLFGVEFYLNDQRENSAPIISDVFSTKQSLSVIQEQQREFAQVYKQSVNINLALELIEQQAEAFELEVKTIELEDNLVSVEGTANNANGLLEQILGSDLVSTAEFKSDIKKSSKNGKEEFELEFNWNERVWHQDLNN